MKQKRIAFLYRMKHEVEESLKFKGSRVAFCDKISNAITFFESFKTTSKEEIAIIKELVPFYKKMEYHKPVKSRKKKHFDKNQLPIETKTTRKVRYDLTP